ncbi:hypothetical protein Lupro_02725 [Lutibacter profundi]|uniref:DUF2007 domain-containing protein n=1 Tax=Lutibacter profundi TaxID=1622118 RepID=A0A0X8G558_9FLAO|nr:DUF2007 domain-containing protein [Lutibacter profundi]AMC10230.1 hypothetical protein Lupro_02725 [Lutibacter profundi]
MGLVTIRTFENGPEAHLFKTKLLSLGIECFIFDEQTITLNPIMGVAIGGIKLKVNENDYEKSNQVITDIENTPLTNEKDEILKCPKCNSIELYTGFKSMKGVKGIISTITSFLFMIYPVYFKNVYKCKDCGNEFDKE